jgi:hypothetical protein
VLIISGEAAGIKIIAYVCGEMKSMKGLLSFLLVLCVCQCFAQAPGWTWAKGLGGTNDDVATCVATDAEGNAFVTGYFRSSTITFGTITLANSNPGSEDIFIVKYDAAGNAVWAKRAGGINIDRGNSISTDLGGNVLVTGWFYSSSISFGASTLTNASPGSTDIFVVKFDSVGNVLFARREGSTGSDAGYSIATDAGANIVVTGTFNSSSIVFGTDTLTNAGNNNFFVVKYDSGGNVMWAKNGGGNGADYVESIKADGGGNILVTGSFWGTSITLGTDTLVNANPNVGDFFVVKYDTAGNVLWAKSAGGPANEVGKSITTDASEDVIVTGAFASTSIVFGTDTFINTGVFDLFVVKYDAGGNIIWAKGVGGTSSDGGNSITSDTSGNVFVTGLFASSSITFGTTTLTSSGGYDMYVVKYDAGGNVLWAKSSGGTGNDGGMSIAITGNGSIFLTGDFYSSSITFGTDTLVNAENTQASRDIYLAKLDAISGTSHFKNENFLVVYPNPSTGTFHIQPKEEIQAIEVYSYLGEKVFTSEGAITAINLTHAAAGIYFYSVRMKDGKVARGKMVKE